MNNKIVSTSLVILWSVFIFKMPPLAQVSKGFFEMFIISGLLLIGSFFVGGLILKLEGYFLAGFPTGMLLMICAYRLEGYQVSSVLVFIILFVVGYVIGAFCSYSVKKELDHPI